jgi:hypothetical protein
MSVFYYGGRPFLIGRHRGLGAAPPAPDQIQRLPLDLLRAHIYPRDPTETRAAIDQSGDTPPTDYIPARMMETRWKTPPYNRTWGSNVVALMESMRVYAARQEQMLAPNAHVPSLETHQAPESLGADRLPQPSDNFAEPVDGVPLARNALPEDRIAVRGDDLAALSLMNIQQRTANHVVQTAKLQTALDSASQSLRVVNKIMRG